MSYDQIRSYVCLKINAIPMCIFLKILSTEYQQSTPVVYKTQKQSTYGEYNSPEHFSMYISHFSIIIQKPSKIMNKKSKIMNKNDI